MNENNFLAFLPKIDDKPFLMKVFILGLLILIFMMLTMVIGLVVAIPFFGFSIFRDFGNFNNLTDPSTINLLKYFQVVNQFGMFILPALFFAYLYKHNAPEYLHLSSKLSFRFLVVSFLLIVFSVPAINYFVIINEQMKLPEILQPIEQWMRSTEDATNRLTEAFLTTSTFGGFLINMLIIALLAALGEELLFRGVILRLLIEGVRNVHLAVFISAVLFSTLHLQFYGFLPRLLIGIIFGYVFVWSANLWIPILLHFVFNGITVIAAYMFELGTISADADSLGRTQNVYVLIGSFIIPIGLLYILYNQRKSFLPPESTE